jgi:outer membrane murein-binding lipoprotein Lpp
LQLVDAQTLISKLQADAADSLAALSVEHLLAAPVGTLVPQALVVSTAKKALAAWLDSESAVGTLNAVVEQLANRLNAERRAIKDVMAKDVRHALREIVGRPFSPDRKLVLTVIDRGPMRELVRQLLLDSVLEFGRRASAPVAGVARGLGSIASMVGDKVKQRSGTIGSLVGAVSGEVERQLEKRAVEFVDSALGGVFGQIADVVSDPRRAGEAAELRLAFFDGALELTGPQLARELANLDVNGGAEILRNGLGRWLASPDADKELNDFIGPLLERDAARPLKDVLADIELLEVTREVAKQQLAARIKLIAATPEFSAWLGSI